MNGSINQEQTQLSCTGTYKKKVGLVMKCSAPLQIEGNKTHFGICIFSWLSLSIQMMSRVQFLIWSHHRKVYSNQPPGFEDPSQPNKVYRVSRQLYGLHQAPKKKKSMLQVDFISEATIRADYSLMIKMIDCFPKQVIWYRSEILATRFVQLFLNKQIEGVDRPQDFIPSVSLPSKVFTFMRKHSTKFSCRITPLTPSMLEVVTALAAEEEHRYCYPQGLLKYKDCLLPKLLLLIGKKNNGTEELILRRKKLQRKEWRTEELDFGDNLKVLQAHSVQFQVMDSKTHNAAEVSCLNFYTKRFEPSRSHTNSTLNTNSRVHTLELEEALMIHMLAERRYPLSKVDDKDADQGMEVEDETETAITLIHLFKLVDN
ncbi:putative ribonuclease H-like domain-containing protein [Tanacetum coccineum]